MEGTESADRAKFFPHAAEYVRSFVFDDVESSASVLFVDDCVLHFTITNLTGFFIFFYNWCCQKEYKTHWL